MSKVLTMMEVLEELLLGPVDQEIVDALKAVNATFERSVTITLPSGTQMTCTEKELRDQIALSTTPWIAVGAQRPEEPVQTV